MSVTSIVVLLSSANKRPDRKRRTERNRLDRQGQAEQRSCKSRRGNGAPLAILLPLLLLCSGCNWNSRCTTLTGSPCDLSAQSKAANGVVMFSSSSIVVNENAGTAVLLVVRSGGSDGSVSVTYSTADGSAIAGRAYTAESGTLTWAAGDSSPKSISIPILDQKLTTGTQAFTAHLSQAAGGATLGSLQAMTITIAENDTAPVGGGTLSFTAATVNVSETANNAVLTVARSGGAAGAVSAHYATGDGSATAGVAYTAASGTLSWSDGDSSTRTLTIPIVNQQLTSGSQAFVVTLTQATGDSTLGDPHIATVTITDNNTPAGLAGTLAFTTATAIVNESAGNALLSVSRTLGSSGATAISYATADGAAVAGIAYTAATGTLHWADGDSSPKVITVPILDQKLTSGSQVFTVVLHDPANGALLGSPAIATINIADDDPAAASPGVVQFASSVANVNEDAGSVVLTLSRTGGAAGALSLEYVTQDQTAVAGVAYAATYGQLNWASGDLSPKTISVPIVDQKLTSGSQTFTVSLSGVTGGAALGASATATVTIHDQDAAPAASSIAFSSAQYYTNGSTGNVELTLLRTGGTAGAITIHYATADNTAVAGTNYTAASGTVSWPANDDSPRTIQVPISAGPSYTNNANAAFYVKLSTGSGAASIGAPGQAIVTIGNPGSVAFSSASYGISETSGFVKLTVNRTSGDNGAVTVGFSTSDGTATAGIDYTAESNTLFWNSTDPSSKTITIPILNANRTSGTRAFTVTLASPVGGVAIGPLAQAIVTINDSSAGPGTVQFTQRAFVVQEDAVEARVSVSRASGSTGPVSVNYQTANRTAVASTDYTATTGTLSWGDQDASVKTLSIPVADLGHWDGSTSTFTVSLSQPSGGVALGSQSTSSVYIAENDKSAGVITFLAPSYILTETSGSLDLTVQRLNGYNGAISVNYATADGTAHQPAEYTPASGTLYWEDGDTTSRTITLPIHDAGSTGGGIHDLTVTLSGEAGGSALGANRATTVQIVSSDREANGCPTTPTLASLGTGVSGPSQYEGDLSGDLSPAYPACSSNFAMYGTTVSASGVTANGVNDYFYGQYNKNNPVRYNVNIPESADLSTLFDNSKGYCTNAANPVSYDISRETVANTPNYEVIAVPDANILNNGHLNNYPQHHQDAAYACYSTQTVLMVTNPSPNAQIINNGVIGDFYVNSFGAYTNPPASANTNEGNYASEQIASGSIFVSNGAHTTITNTARGYIGSANGIFTFNGGGTIYNYGIIAGQNDSILSSYAQTNFDNGGLGMSNLGFAGTHAYTGFQNYGYILCNDYGVLVEGPDTNANTYGGKQVPGVTDFLGRNVYNGEISCQVFPSHRTVTDPDRLSVNPVMMDGTGETINLVSRTIDGVVYLPVIVSEMNGGFNGSFAGGKGANTLNFNFTGLSLADYHTLIDAIASSEQQTTHGTYFTGSVAIQGISYNWSSFAYVNFTGKVPE